MEQPSKVSSSDPERCSYAALRGLVVVAVMAAGVQFAYSCWNGPWLAICVSLVAFLLGFSIALSAPYYLDYEIRADWDSSAMMYPIFVVLVTFVVVPGRVQTLLTG